MEVDSWNAGELGSCACLVRVRRGTGTFSRGLGWRWVGIFAGGIGVGGGKMSQSPGLWRMGAEWVPVGARGARVVVSTVICERLRRWPRVPPLPRDPLCPTQSTPSRGRGRGWENIELSFPRWDARVFAIGNAAPHPPFGHLPPEGEGSVEGRFGEGRLVSIGFRACLEESTLIGTRPVGPLLQAQGEALGGCP